jgi:HEAT repeat protein
MTGKSGDEPSLGGQGDEFSASVRLGGERAILHLMEIIQKDHSPDRWSSEDQRYALERLAALGSEQALDQLINFLPQAYMLTPRVIQAISQFDDERALQTILAVDYDALDFPHSLHAKRAVTIAFKQWIDEPAVIERLFVVLTDTQEIGDEAARSLSTSTNPAVIQRLLDAVISGELPLSAGASNALALMKSPETVPPLIEALSHPLRTVREAAAYCLGSIGDQRAADPLFALIQTDDLRRDTVVSALGPLRDQRAIEPLSALLQELEDNGDLRFYSQYYANMIADIDADTSFEALLHVLSETEHENVIEAVHLALGQLGDARAAPVLGDAVGDLSNERQRDALLELLQIRHPFAVEPLQRASGIADWADRLIVSVLRRIATPEALAAVAAWEEEQQDRDA